MKIKQITELIHRSSHRLMDAVSKPDDKYWRSFMRRESSQLLRLSVKLWIKLRFGGEKAGSGPGPEDCEKGRR